MILHAGVRAALPVRCAAIFEKAVAIQPRVAIKAMTNKGSRQIDCPSTSRCQAFDFGSLSHAILYYAASQSPKAAFLRKVSGMLVERLKCDSVELLVDKGETWLVCSAVRETGGKARVAVASRPRRDDRSNARAAGECIAEVVDESRLCALVTLGVADETVGLLRLARKHGPCFSESQLRGLEKAAQTLAVGILNQRARAALHERVKELTCLCGIAQIAERPAMLLGDVLQGIVALLPPAWQYPDVTLARIVLDGSSYSTPGFCDGCQKQVAEIVVNRKHRGTIAVIYVETRPKLDEGPFLREERHLIDAVARQVAFIIERREAEQEKSLLQEQLMHADRLATIGQLAAGVAHELNEPLGNILGFAQLAQKSAGLPQRAGEDIGKIEGAALHAREIVRKLLLFARQMPSKKTRTNLNHIVEEGLYFIEARCTKAGIELHRNLSPNMPEIIADPALLTQVLVNLVVNAVQAMPDGGKLTVATGHGESQVWLLVEDTGAGMSDETKKQVFAPFFTTKEVGKGTGLGLPVVHGIVTSHGGAIEVDSEVGRGTRFKIRLPISSPQPAEENQ